MPSSICARHLELLGVVSDYVVNYHHLTASDADNKTIRRFRQAEECVSTVLGSLWTIQVR